MAKCNFLQPHGHQALRWTHSFLLDPTLSTRKRAHHEPCPKTIAVLAAGTAVAGLSRSSAFADAPWANDSYNICAPTPYDYHQGPGWPCVNRSYAGINWYNRTAHIQGAVTDDVDLWSTTTVYFQAFAGNKLVESTSRRSERASVSFNFPIGDSTLPGGIDLIKVQVCHVRPPTDPAGKCTIQYNLWRD
ncbi:hypothetical protein GCM10027269_21480 [Kribbella endophytica]